MRQLQLDRYSVAGVMSGTSLDGLDIALCNFTKVDSEWRSEIVEAVTVPYSKEWLSRLELAPTVSGYDLIDLHNSYGVYIGEAVKRFLSGREVDIIASHGHTIFHKPDKQLTFQVGNGASVAAVAGVSTVSDFRTLDVALGGQGAPLVPVGDLSLFNEYKFCLNLGGFSNISVKLDIDRDELGSRVSDRSVIAGDLSPVNMALNGIVSEINLKYDRDGELGRAGDIDSKLLSELNSLEFYDLPFPKSLGREWYEDNMLPLLEQSTLSVESKLATCCEHVAMQIGKFVSKYSSSVDEKMLVTGGGALNCYLMERISHHTPVDTVIPEREVVEYKEALIFAFLGVLYLEGLDGCLESVTGAKGSSIGGCLYKI